MSDVSNAVGYSSPTVPQRHKQIADSANCCVLVAPSYGLGGATPPKSGLQEVQQGFRVCLSVRLENWSGETRACELVLMKQQLVAVGAPVPNQQHRYGARKDTATQARTWHPT